MFRLLVPAISTASLLCGVSFGQPPELAKSTLNPRGRTVATPVISEAQIRAAVREEIGSQLKAGLDRLVQSGVLKGDPGKDGAGIDDVVIRNLPAGSEATREIITDPEDGARVLVLGLPLPKPGADGGTPTIDYATVVANLRNDAAFRTEVSKLVSSPTVDYDTLLARFKSDGSFVGPPGEPGAAGAPGEPGTPGEDGASGGMGAGAVSAIAGGTGVAGVGLGSLALALLRRRKEGDAGDGDTFRERRRERVRVNSGAVYPVDPEDGRQLLQLARSEGRSPLLDAIAGRVGFDRLDEIIDSSRTEPKEREWARRLRQELIDDVNELAPLSTRERFG